MLLKTRGIVLRSVKYSETSIITDIFTEAKGLRSYIISGVRSKNARTKASLLQHMSLVDLVVYHRDDKQLTRIKEIKSAYVYQSIPFDVIKGAIGLFMTELAQKTIVEKEENKTLFDFLFYNFQFLDSTTESVANLHLHFMLELSTILGFMPNGNIEDNGSYFDLKEGTFTSSEPSHLNVLSPELAIYLDAILRTPKDKVHSIAIPKNHRKELLNGLLDYYKLHIENLSTINAHLILETVLS